MNQIVALQLGNSFPLATRILGFALLLAGFMGLLALSIFGFIALLLGILLALTKDEFQIDLEKRIYRSSTKFIGLNTGKWHTYETLPFICILKHNLVHKNTSHKTMAQITSKEIAYEVNLLNQSHRKKVKVQRFSSIEEANELAQRLATQMNLQIVQYNPVRSPRRKRK